MQKSAEKQKRNVNKCRNTKKTCMKKENLHSRKAKIKKQKNEKAEKLKY